MSTSVTPSIAKVAGDLLQLSQQRQQQIDLHLRVAETTRQAREQAIDRSMAVSARQANLVQEVKEAGARTRASGIIDTWA